MHIKTHTITVDTPSKDAMIDITAQVRDFLASSQITHGRLLLFVPHTTAAVTINENADPDVQRDMIKGINKVFIDDPEYAHMEGNSDAHIKSSMVGCEQMLIVENRQMMLGTWQGIYFCEFDGPRRRKLHMQIIGE